VIGGEVEVRLPVVLVIGDEQAGRISDEQPLRIEHTERP